MSDALFLTDDDDLSSLTEGAVCAVSGREGRHASVVRRIGVGETVVIADGAGHGIRGPVVRVDAAGLLVEVREHLLTPTAPRRWVVAQALPKGERAELAVEMLTELGVDEIIPWQASRSVVRWSAERAAKGLARWGAAAREATKQSRRLCVPAVSHPCGSQRLVERIRAADLALVLHEESCEPIGSMTLPERGEVLLVVGPEGGISPEERAMFEAAGARAASLGDGVLRTSTAGVAALAALKLR